MKKYLLPQEGKFYKACLHTHTTVSDGQRTPQEVKEAYKAQGYSIVAYTDHEVLVPHNDLADETFLPIVSYEIAINQSERPLPFDYIKAYHLNLYARDKNVKIAPVWKKERVWSTHFLKSVIPEQYDVDYDLAYSTESINEMIRYANEHGFFVSYNHPVWSTQTYPDYAGLKGLWGVEVYNTGCNIGGYPENDRAFDDLLQQGEHVFPLATDDSHTPYDCFGGWVMVKAAALEYDTVIRALEQGEFYASTGPEIHALTIEDGVVHIECSKTTEVRLTTERRYAMNVRDEQGSITSADFDIKAYLDGNKQENRYRKGFIRLTVVDEKGNMAYTRAFFEDEL